MAHRKAAAADSTMGLLCLQRSNSRDRLVASTVACRLQKTRIKGEASILITAKSLNLFK
jgi:hypothetical protein